MLPHGMAPASRARAIAAAPTSPMLVSPSCRIARLRGSAAAAAAVAVAMVALPAASAAAVPAAPERCSSRGLSSSAAARAAQPASAMGFEPSASRRRTERSPGWGSGSGSGLGSGSECAPPDAPPPAVAVSASASAHAAASPSPQSCSSSTSSAPSALSAEASAAQPTSPGTYRVAQARCIGPVAASIGLQAPAHRVAGVVRRARIPTDAAEAELHLPAASAEEGGGRHRAARQHHVGRVEAHARPGYGVITT
eukprot:scaffold3863_cov59-Phaeocystis_antarctica.AAC.2